MVDADDIARAKAVPIASVVEHLKLKRRGRELVGACPVCGGTDRFGVHIVKGVFNCRGCKASGDVIQLVRLLEGCTFAEAVERLAGGFEPTSRPMSTAERRRAGDDNERRKLIWAANIWDMAAPIAGTPGADYFMHAACNEWRKETPKMNPRSPFSTIRRRRRS